MASITSKSTQNPYLLDIPEDEHQRGRKRRRSSAAANSPTGQIPSGGSTTLRGRGRRRSLSPAQSFPQDTTSLHIEEKHRSASPHGRKSPGRKYQKKYLEVVQERKKRRSQSPSRSRSKGRREGTPKPRRRQRTRTRSRSHGEDKRVDERVEIREHGDVAVKDYEVHQ